MNPPFNMAQRFAALSDSIAPKHSAEQSAAHENVIVESE
jgi:hypothetical protein